MGGSSPQSLTMSLDLHLQKARLLRIVLCFKYAMNASEEYPPCMMLHLPDLPPMSLVDAYVNALVRKVHPLYPVLDLDQLSADLKRDRAYQDTSWDSSSGFPGFASFSKGADAPKY